MKRRPAQFFGFFAASPVLTRSDIHADEIHKCKPSAKRCSEDVASFLTDNNKTHYIMKNPKRIHKLPKPAPTPKKLTLSLEDKDGKPLDPPLDGTDRLLILQAIQFNNINAPVDQFAKLFQTDEASIEADIEHLKQLQQRVRLRINAVSDKPAS